MTITVTTNDCVILDGVKYRQSETHTNINGKPYTVCNLIPVFKSEEERSAAKEKIGNELFRVFRKYMT